MKIVIEIPEMAYEAFKEWDKNKVATVEQSLIAQGTPYEETGGKWIEETDEHLKGMYRCSKCGRRVDGSVLDDLLMVDEDYTIADIYPYCHCGAYMRRANVHSKEYRRQRMTNDLISRSALKKAFEEVYPLSTNEMGGVINKRIYDIIDNAPTVLHDNYSMGYQDGVKKVLSERPTGHWIEDIHEDYTPNHDTWECSNCGEPYMLMEGTPENNKYNYCPNCGAHMLTKIK